jgi:hypothetical protein
VSFRAVGVQVHVFLLQSVPSLLTSREAQREPPGPGLAFEKPTSFAAEKRQAEAARIRDKYPDRIPVGVRELRGWFFSALSGARWTVVLSWAGCTGYRGEGREE